MVSGRAITACSSYREMWREGPPFALESAPCERPVEVLAQPGQPGGKRPHPVHAGGSAPGKRARTGQVGLERGDGSQRVRRRNEAREVVL